MVVNQSVGLSLHFWSNWHLTFTQIDIKLINHPSINVTLVSNIASYGSTASSAFLHDYCSSTQSLNQSAPATFNLPPAPPASSTSLSSSCTNDYVNFRLGPSTHGSVYNSTLSTNITNQAKKQVHNEPPPAYESLLVKSSSLPSYCHLSDGKEDARKESYDKNTSSNDDATRKK